MRLLVALMLVVSTASAEIRTITHPRDNHWTSPRQDLRDMFTLYEAQWSDGKPVKIGLLPWHSPTHHEFVKTELRGSPVLYRSIVESRINRGLASHVTQLYSSKEAIEFVMNTPGAVSYGENYLIMQEEGSVRIITITD